MHGTSLNHHTCPIMRWVWSVRNGQSHHASIRYFPVQGRYLYSMLKSMLFNSDFSTSLLIGWCMCCHSVRSHVRESLSNNMIQAPGITDHGIETGDNARVVNGSFIKWVTFSRFLCMVLTLRCWKSESLVWRISDEMFPRKPWCTMHN